jgi:hypothetical protein
MMTSPGGAGTHGGHKRKAFHMCFSADAWRAQRPAPTKERRESLQRPTVIPRTGCEQTLVQP